ncbi:MAG: NADH-quinone oxidoreductase subunit N [Acidobacteria bacterium]|nr:NADH-quinone oxidoreductase subunit N [Acidobacteriota bacterium]
MQLETLNLNYWAIGPELAVSIGAVILMMMDAFSKKGGYKANMVVALLTLLTALGFLVGLAGHEGGSSFSGMVVVDQVRIFAAATVLLIAIIAVLLAAQFIEDEGLPAGEFFSLLLFAVSGMLLLTAAGDLVTLFLGLEIASITTYILAGYRRYDIRANESSLKYFLLGAFSTAFLLYGMALTYGATGTTNINAMREAIAAGTINFPGLLLLGAAIILVGFAFKLGSAPFHLWTPDVYEGAPTIVTGFMGTAPKVAVFAAFIRLFIGGFDVPVEGVGLQLHQGWINSVAIISAISMTVGNVIALSQRNIKRLLAYSSIAHAGYALIGFVTGDSSTVLFYLLAYSIVSVGAFAVIQLLARAGDQRTQIDDLAGIGFEAPTLSFPLAIFLLSLAGIPSTAGFIGKFYVFKTAWVSTPTLKFLVVVAVVNSIISIYYYLYPIVVMFFRPLAPGFVKPRLMITTSLALILTILGTFYLGLMPNRLLRALERGVSVAVNSDLGARSSQ